MKASLIISVYKNTNALRRILHACLTQSERDFEIIISEDGQYTPIANLVREWHSVHPDIALQHLTQLDKGWRKNRALNRAVVAARASWLIFIDGDCIPHRKFVEWHLRMAAPKNICAGARIKLGKHGLIGATHLEEAFFMPWINRRIHHLTGCNMSMAKTALLDIGGFDEHYNTPSVGEDYDIEVRFLKKGYRLVSLRNKAVVYHLYHPENWDRRTQDANMAYLKQKMSAE